MLRLHALQPYAAILCLLVFSLTSCQSKLNDTDIRWVPGIQGKKPGNLSRVDGIRQALSETEKPVRVFIVHGMITKDPNYSVEFQAALGETLQLIRGKQYPVQYINRGYGFEVFSGPQPFVSKMPLSELRKTSWLDDHNNERLVVYELLWAPLRDRLKRQFLSCYESRLDNDCENVTDVNRAADGRSWINGWLKDDVMVNGFADAMLVLSPVGDVLRDDVTQAMCTIASDALRDTGFKMPEAATRCDLIGQDLSQEARQGAALALAKTKFVTITHSLGSFLVLDTQQQYARTKVRSETKANHETADERRDLLLFQLTDQSSVFMMANQVGLLQLARLKAGCFSEGIEPDCPNRFLPPVHDAMEEDARSQMRKIVAFNDSNDLLGFELQPYQSEMSLFGFLINVSVRNSGFSIPWLFKNPKSVHTTHFENRAIINAVAEGFELK